MGKMTTATFVKPLDNYQISTPHSRKPKFCMKLVLRVFKDILPLHRLYQGGPTFFSPWTENSFPVGPKGQGILSGITSEK
jgi:hypothetical protein